MEKFDLVVVGGGPGGYPAAVRAAQEGLSVALVEMDSLGGECTNYGCIPTKALLHPAGLAASLARLEFARASVDFDFKGLMDWVDNVVKSVSKGVSTLLKGYGVEVVKGRAAIGDGAVEVDSVGSIGYSKLVLALGTSPASIPGLEPDGEVVHNNRTILGLRRKPGRMLIIGGGYIGVEYATAMARLGVEVTIVELLDRLLPTMQRDFSRVVERRLKSEGVSIHTKTRVESVEGRERYAIADISGVGRMEFDTILVAVGRRPNTRGVGLERLGVKLDKAGYIQVDKETLETGVPGVYASGDVTGPPLLAHRAFLQAVVAAERAAGDSTAAFDAKAVPAVVYTDPELATVGLTLDEAKAAGIEAAEARLPLASLPRVGAIEGCRECFAKVVYEKSSRAVLGFHVAAPHASEIIAEAALAIEMGATLEDLSLTIHPHPSVSEALKEVAELALEKPIHYILRRGAAKR
ncbi:dihydrolipoyl dehydrogenase [Aeropyrum camini]|uniref:Dihydrolipoyl dehydrogenase n=1 Tax=Aeropyrum camini SY1 = JCM 12091 TaxID=1198449 RepID=U3TEQ7_9CREN|nr:dihydrolipoyl dehydrogenase [Aeropyrum camini]BAN90515.1 dihydrolipoyl dehydrogenase [Aeropyrum camini SY1 = JCM 12091]